MKRRPNTLAPVSAISEHYKVKQIDGRSMLKPWVSTTPTPHLDCNVAAYVSRRCRRWLILIDFIAFIIVQSSNSCFLFSDSDRIWDVFTFNDSRFQLKSNLKALRYWNWHANVMLCTFAPATQTFRLAQHSDVQQSCDIIQTQTLTLTQTRLWLWLWLFD